MGLLETFARHLETVSPVNGIHAARLAALAHAGVRGLPEISDEDWKYTDIGRLHRIEFNLGRSPDRAPVAVPLAGLEAHRVVFINGHFSAVHSTLDTLPKEVRLRLFHRASTEEPEWLATHLGKLGTGDASAFAALNAAGAQDGVAVELANAYRLVQPLLVIFMNTGELHPSVVSPHLHVSAGAGAEASIIELHVGDGEATSLTNAFTRIETSRGARISHYRAICEAVNATHIGQLQLDIGSDSEVENFSLALGGRLIRVDIDCRLAAAGGKVVLNGVFVAGLDQHIDHHTRVDHRASHTSSDETYRGIADGNGRGVFNGKIIVQPGVEKIVATQASHNLLLSNEGEIDTKPELEIYADDLRCAHGATVGQLDEDALFYLRARGVPEAEARALLVYGFVQASLATIPVRELQALVSSRFANDNEALARILSGNLI